MGWIADSFGDKAEKLVTKLQDDLVVSEDIHKQRLDICKACENLNKFNLCTQCYCYMPLKTKFKVFSCPLEKW